MGVSKLESAVLALKGPLVGVLLPVSVQRRFLLEGRVTEVTLVATLLAVDLDVVPQVVHAHKRLAALLAYVRLVRPVGLDVLVQPRGELEGEAADGALVLLSVVNAAMLLEGALAFERFVALFADVLREVLRLVQVSFQVRDVRENFTALRTLMVFNPRLLARLLFERCEEVVQRIGRVIFVVVWILNPGIILNLWPVIIIRIIVFVRARLRLLIRA